MPNGLREQALGTLSALLITFLPIAAPAAPGDILFSDNFSRATLAPWTTTNASASGILVGPQTSGSNSRAGYTRNQAVTVTSPSFNAAVPAARLEIWVRRGSDAISEDPDTGENFVIEYQRADSSWNQLVTYLGSGTPGQIYQASFSLPADALHGTLAVRVRQTNGSGFDFDYWHFDDVIVTEIAVAGPLAVGVCDYFENGLGGNWTVNPTSGLAGTSAATSSSPSNSMFLNGGVVNVTSNVVDTTDITFSDLSIWVRRGADSFSEDPDGGENLVVEYRNDVGAWITLETFNGAGGPGQIFVRSYTLPAAGRHANMQLRFTMIAGSGPTWDFWHVDDVCFEQDPDPILQVTKVATTLSDPINGASSPKSIPGAIVEYTVTLVNLGIGTVDADSIVIEDPVPANTALYVDTGAGDPIVFVDGATASGLSYNFATDVTFSNQVGGGAPFTYIPMPDGQGFDPLVTGLRAAPTGTMNGSVGGNNPSFDIIFQIRID